MKKGCAVTSNISKYADKIRCTYMSNIFDITMELTLDFTLSAF